MGYWYMYKRILARKQLNKYVSYNNHEARLLA